MTKLLIVDDQPNIRRMIRMALDNRFDLEEAGDAMSALSLIQASRPDGVVLDVMMPGPMDGFQLCDHIKSDAALSSIHVVLITARGQVADQELGRALGADAYFIKPFSPLSLAHHLVSALLPIH
jgi:DNA-binding response OmpR family regulator